ncbi:hypothetical protein HY230_07680 [Candidatus Acetothermia bacterium]|nr:hypothetical protein [Candidatus Acetothermia bacterium]
MYRGSAFYRFARGTAGACSCTDRILRWLSGFKRAPQQTFIVHGEPEAALSLKAKIEQQLHWPVRVPEYLNSVNLEAVSQPS